MIRYKLLILQLLVSIYSMGQIDLSLYYGEHTRKNYLKKKHTERFGELKENSTFQKVDSIYFLLEQIDIITLLSKSKNVTVCYTPLPFIQIVDGELNIVAGIMADMNSFSYREIGKQGFSEMTYALIDTIIYDKPFTRWDTERISKLYMEKIKQKKRKERKKFNLTFIECQEPLMGYSTNKFHKKNIYQFTPPIFDCEYRTAMIFVKKEGDGFSILFFRRSLDENNIWQPWEFVYYYNLYGFSHEIYTKEWYKNRE